MNKITHTIIFLLFWSFFIPAQGASSPSNQPILMLMKFHNATGHSDYDALAKAMGDILLSCLSTAPDRLTIVMRSDETQNEIAHSQANLSSPNFSMNKTFGATHLVRGSIVLLNEKLIINALTFEIKNTRLVSASRLELTQYDLSSKTCEQWVTLLVASINKKIGENTQHLSNILPRRNHLNIAISQYNKGDYESAISNLLELSHKYPQDITTEFWLVKSFNAVKNPQLSLAFGTDFVKNFPNTPKAKEIQLLLSESKKPAMEKYRD
jgi:TolB-like protein